MSDHNKNEKRPELPNLDEPIRIPPAQRWRLVRPQVMHAIAFLVVCLAAAWAWQNMTRPLTFAGHAEVIQANVTSPETGLLSNLVVSTFQQVNAGQRVADVVVTRTGDSSRGGGPASVPLIAPITGVVSTIHNQLGEHVLAGQAVMTITLQDCNRILGFVPSSFPQMPEVGMSVQVRTRSSKHSKGYGKITAIGPQWQPLTNNPLHSLTGNSPAQRVGRPVTISLPPDLRLTPGEPVDLTLMIK